MYSNNIGNFQESTTILNAYTKSLETYWMPHVLELEIEVFDRFTVCIQMTDD